MRLLSQALVVGTLVAALTGTAISTHAQDAEKPNIVIMVMDNLGWGEIGVYGGGILRGAPTPRLDTLASEGMRFLNFNVETQCTPQPVRAHDGSAPDPIRHHQGGLGAALRHDSLGSHHGRAAV